MLALMVSGAPCQSAARRTAQGALRQRVCPCSTARRKGVRLQNLRRHDTLYWAHLAGALDDALHKEHANEGRSHAAQPEDEGEVQVQLVPEAEGQRGRGGREEDHESRGGGRCLGVDVELQQERVHNHAPADAQQACEEGTNVVNQDFADQRRIIFAMLVAAWGWM